MKERHARIEAIRRIISTERIENQEELRERLGAEGISVTQATLSRDLKYIRVGKVADGGGGYHYALTDDGSDYLRDMFRGWISIDFSGNIGVVKTLPGHADSVAIALDDIEFDELLGTVAGDDTILLVLREGARPDDFLRSLAEAAPGIAFSRSDAGTTEV